MPTTYATYPQCDDTSIPVGEQVIQSQLLLIEQIQRELWGTPINDGNILKPGDPNLMFNWIAGGVFQYQPKNVISSTYALSLPESDPYVDDDGVKWSGLGIEYFIETRTSQDWAINLLVNVASNVYRENGHILFPGMFIPSTAGFIPDAMNPGGLHLLSIVDKTIEMPDGRCDYVQLVPLTDRLKDEYMSLGENKARLATDWFTSGGYNRCFG